MLIGIYLRTLRYLSVSQILFLLFRRIRRSIGKIELVERKSPSRDSSLKLKKTWNEPLEYEYDFNQDGEFNLFGESGNVFLDGWQGTTQTPLWKYHLHYFDFLLLEISSADRGFGAKAIRHWVENNSIGKSPGWDPYPTSLRIVNWIKWCLAGNQLDAELNQSLYAQARYLRRNVERHLMGNHLIANLKALIFAGRYFTGREAKGWVTFAHKQLVLQLSTQFEADGGHYELSPMYHSIVIRDLLDILNLTEGLQISDADVTCIRQVCTSGLRWMQYMSHPDGKPAFFNDTNFSNSVPLESLLEYCAALRLDSWRTPLAVTSAVRASGYGRLERRGVTVFCDVARVGASEQPGHSHADSLSFELSAGTQRIFVNSGVSTYSDGSTRLWERSTAAHNTIEINSANSSEVWRSFRCGARAQVAVELFEQTGDVITLKAAHDGYASGSRSVTHTRQWSLSSSRLHVVDLLEGRYSSAVSRLYLHPSLSVTAKGQFVEIVSPNGEVFAFKFYGGKLELQNSYWSPYFGSQIPNQCIVMKLNGKKSEFIIEFQ